MSRKSRARHLELLYEIEKPEPSLPTVTIRRTGWMTYEVTSPGLSDPVVMSTSEVQELRKALEIVRRVLPSIAVEDWHRRSKPLFAWPGGRGKGK